MKKILAIVTVFSIVAINGFMLMEGAMVSAETDTTDPWTLNHTVYVDVTAEMSLTCATDADLDLGDISGLTGGTGSGSTACNVSTNNTAGYTLAFTSAVTSGLENAQSVAIPAYATTGAWAIGTTQSAIGYNMASSSLTDTGWKGLTSAGDTITDASAPTAFAGTDTTLYYYVEVGTERAQPTGKYESLVTFTALMK